jgi:hypothetical protein
MLCAMMLDAVAGCGARVVLVCRASVLVWWSAVFLSRDVQSCNLPVISNCKVGNEI